MVKEEPTRKITKRLKAAGFTRTDAEGSHGKWTHLSGARVSIPDGHRTISPGVVPPGQQRHQGGHQARRR
jgi:predicted RNA binding protein YcfA (HicA-like mRNA interferase family)